MFCDVLALGTTCSCSTTFNPQVRKHGLCLQEECFQGTRPPAVSGQKEIAVYLPDSAQVPQVENVVELSRRR